MQAAIQQRGVIQAILKHGIAFADQRLNRPQIGHKTGGEENRSVPSGKGSQLLFQSVMFGTVTVHQM